MKGLRLRGSITSPQLYVWIHIGMPFGALSVFQAFENQKLCPVGLSQITRDENKMFVCVFCVSLRVLFGEGTASVRFSWHTCGSWRAACVQTTAREVYLQRKNIGTLLPRATPKTHVISEDSILKPGLRTPTSSHNINLSCREMSKVPPDVLEQTCSSGGLRATCGPEANLEWPGQEVREKSRKTCCASLKKFLKTLNATLNPQYSELLWMCV